MRYSLLQEFESTVQNIVDYECNNQYQPTTYVIYLRLRILKIENYLETSQAIG